MALIWLAQAYPTIAAATALVGIGIGVGKIIIAVDFLKREVAELKKEHAEMKMEQLETKLLLKQILKRLKMPF